MTILLNKHNTKIEHVALYVISPIKYHHVCTTTLSLIISFTSTQQYPTLSLYDNYYIKQTVAPQQSVHQYGIFFKKTIFQRLL